ncbi:unnamed protein product, partial [Thlaspi arvense]
MKDGKVVCSDSRGCKHCRTHLALSEDVVSKFCLQAVLDDWMNAKLEQFCQSRDESSEVIDSAKQSIPGLSSARDITRLRSSYL